MLIKTEEYRKNGIFISREEEVWVAAILSISNDNGVYQIFTSLGEYRISEKEYEKYSEYLSMTVEQYYNKPKTFLEWVTYIECGDLDWYNHCVACGESLYKDIFGDDMENDLKKEFGNNYCEPK